MRHKLNLPLLGITALAAVLRLFRLTAISLWHDEAFSALLIKYPWGEMLRRIGLDVHPPMYYIFLRVWTDVFGSSIFSLRGFSAFFGVLAVPATYYLVKQIFKNQRTAMIAAVLVAISPFQLLYGTEARMYTMGAFFAITSALFLARALEGHKLWTERHQENTTSLPGDKQLKRRFLLHFLLFIISTVIIIYTHYYLLFTAAAICFYGLIFHWRTHKDKLARYGWLFLSYLLIALSFLPWLKIFLFQFRQVGGGYWIPPINFWSIPDTLWRMLIGLYTSTIPNHYWLVGSTLAVLFILVYVIRKVQFHEKWLIILNIVAPFAGAVLFFIIATLRHQDSSVYLVRYFLFSSAFFLIAVALFLEHLRPRRLAHILTGCLIIINLFSFANYWQGLDIKNKTGMSGASELLKTNVQPGDKIYVGISAEFFNYKYYNSRADMPVKPLLFTAGKTTVNQLPHYFGTALLDDADLVPDFKTAAGNGDTVWLLWTNAFEGGSGPAVPANWTKIYEYGFADVRPYPGTWIVVTQYKVN